MNCQKCGSQTIQQSNKLGWFPIGFLFRLDRCHDCGKSHRVPFWTKRTQLPSPLQAVRKPFKVQRRRDNQTPKP